MDSIAYANPNSINGLNLYAYCGNNPVMNIDPTGHFAWPIIPIIGLALSVLFLKNSSGPSKEEIEAAKNAATNEYVKYKIRELDGGKVTVDIDIDIEHQVVLDLMVRDYYFDAMYEQTKKKLLEKGYSLDDAILMDKGHIKWEYGLHSAGYGLWGNIKEHCRIAHLNYEENIFTILGRVK